MVWDQWVRVSAPQPRGEAYSLNNIGGWWWWFFSKKQSSGINYNPAEIRMLTRLYVLTHLLKTPWLPWRGLQLLVLFAKLAFKSRYVGPTAFFDLSLQRQGVCGSLQFIQDSSF